MYTCLLYTSDFFVIGDIVKVDFSQKVVFDHLLDHIVGGTYHIVAYASGFNYRIHFFVGFKYVVDHLNTGFLFKVVDDAFVNIFAPVVYCLLYTSFGAKGLAYIAINEDGTFKSSFAKFMKEEEMAALIAAMDGKAGDLPLFAADKDKVVFDVLGNLRLELARQLDLLKKDDFKFLWVTEFPLLEYSEEEDRYVAMHHPFTMPMEEDLQYLDSDPGRVRAKAYDIVLNGVEMGGGSVRIHQADIQSRMFEVLGFTPERAQEQFGFLLKAFKYGVPPHAGLAYGLDRMVMLMVGADSIRDAVSYTHLDVYKRQDDRHERGLRPSPWHGTLLSLPPEKHGRKF